MKKKKIGELIREKRKAKGLTLGEVSEKSGIATGYLSRLERGSMIRVSLRSKRSQTPWDLM